MIIEDIGMKSIRRSLGRELQLIRWQKGFKLKTVSHLTGLDPDYIDQTEVGKYSSYRVIRLLLGLYQKNIEINLVDHK